MHYALKREVETLSKISHVCEPFHHLVRWTNVAQPHIVDYIASQGWDGPAVEIFMGLKEGNLSSFVTSEPVPCTDELAWSIFHQMLQALNCLALHGIVHRDVKPENIPYTSLPDGQYQFQLGDFGVCNRAVSAVTSVGTPIYMAPEVYRQEQQTHKMDVWSLFVTMAWILNVDGFHLKSRQFQSIQQVEQAVLAVAASPNVSRIQEMARTDPATRVSAAQMLIECFDGKGLAASQKEVPQSMGSANLGSSPPPASAQASRSVTMHREPRAEQGRSNCIPAQFRIRKPRTSRQARVLGQDGMATVRQSGEGFTRRRLNHRDGNPPPDFMAGLIWRARQNNRTPPPSGSRGRDTGEKEVMFMLQPT